VLSIRDDQTSGEPVVLTQAPVTAVKPTGEEIEITEVTATQPATVADTLPSTASSLPPLGLVGLLSLAAGLVLRRSEVTTSA
jgi:LPXTG-motif cell wall-anchored protein